MCDATLRDRKRTVELMDCLGIVGMEEVVSQGRLRWYEHVESKDRSDWLSACMDLQVEGANGKVRSGRKR